MRTLTVALSLLVLAVALEEALGLPRPAHKRVRRQMDSSSSDSPDSSDSSNSLDSPDDDFRVCGLGVNSPCASANCCPANTPCVNYIPTSADFSIVSQLGFPLQVCAETCSNLGSACPGLDGTMCENRGGGARCWPQASVCDIARSTESASMETEPCEMCEQQFETRAQELSNLCPPPPPAPAAPAAPGVL